MKIQEKMNIATALNKKYLLYTAVMLASFCENNQRPVRLFLLHSELQEADIARLRVNLRDFEIEIVSLKVCGELFSSRLPRNEQWSIETYYRLLLLDLLPEDVHRLLYIDVDIIINQSLEEIYETEFGENEIIAAEDSCGKKTWEKFGDKQKQMFEPMVRAGYHYFNAGFMLMNIDKMRCKYSFDKYLAAIEEWDYQMDAPDQDILNYVHWKYVGYMDYKKYDLFARIAHNMGMTYEEVKKNTAVIHYAGDKPWESANCHFDIEQIWWDYAKKTDLYLELLEDFLKKTMFSGHLENYICSLMQEAEDAKKKLAESIKINEKLFSLIRR